jgi:hypothetical protein
MLTLPRIDIFVSASFVPARSTLAIDVGLIFPFVTTGGAGGSVSNVNGLANTLLLAHRSTSTPEIEYPAASLQTTARRVNTHCLFVTTVCGLRSPDWRLLFLAQSTTSFSVYPDPNLVSV